MSLVGALYTGRTGLTVNQAALEVTGNNLANAATPGYSRQSALTVAARGVEVQPGAFIGAGTRLQQIIRHVDEALNTRLRSAMSDQHAALGRQDLLSQIESIHNELSDQGLGSRLSRLFNAFAEVAGNPTDSGLRSLAIAEGASFAGFLNNIHADLTALRQQVDDAIRSAVEAADGVLGRIAALNQQIATAERGLGGANALRDERDRLLDELGTYFDITTVEQPNGMVDVLVNSVPVVLAGENRGLDLETRVEDNELQILLRLRADGNVLRPDSGRIGQLIASRETDVNAAIRTLDELAGALIFELNKLHSSGQGETGFASLTATSAVDDPAAALNSAAADLPFRAVNGSFVLHVTQRSTGARQSVRIEVDLDGLGADTTLADLAAAIDAVDNLSASITPDGRLTIGADSSDFRFTFSEDSSGALAALGLNTFFTGSGAQDIAVNEALRADPSLLAAAQGHVGGDNRNALALAALADQGIETLGGLSLRQFWARHIEDYAIRTDQNAQQVSATQLITEGLRTQRQSVSGVNIDEEAINMLAFQRAFQGSARFITVVDELMQTMLGLIR